MIGVPDAFTAKLTEMSGFKGLYLSGSSVACQEYGLPDLGITSLEQVLHKVHSLTDACSLPLLVDIDTGWGTPLTIERAVQQLEKAGAAAVQIEDQPFGKRCGHRAGKEVVSTEEMCERITAASEAKSVETFQIVARTDAYGLEPLETVLARARSYIEAGADILFVEAVTDPNDYSTFKKLGVPILANLTEFGKTPLVDCETLASHGVDIALYPLTLNRVMNEAAWHALKALQATGTQKELLPMMMTREETYRVIDYETHEERMNQWQK